MLAIEVASLGTGSPEAFHSRSVSGVAAGADEVIEGQGQRFTQRLEGGRVAVDQFPGW
jgi:hypothetical protein